MSHDDDNQDHSPDDCPECRVIVVSDGDSMPMMPAELMDQMRIKSCIDAAWDESQPFVSYEGLDGPLFREMIMALSQFWTDAFIANRSGKLMEERFNKSLAKQVKRFLKKEGLPVKAISMAARQVFEKKRQVILQDMRDEIDQARSTGQVS